MPPFFDTIKSFADVPISEDGVDTQQFLEACDGFNRLFDYMGSAIFGLVQYEYKRDTNAVRTRFEATREVSDTLENLLHNESNEPRKHTTIAFVRLIRGLLFAYHGLQKLHDDPTIELSDAFKQSYDTVLRRHYSFVTNGPVSLALRAAPSKISFYTRLAQGSSIEEMEEKMKQWLVGLDAITKHIRLFVERGGYGDV